MNFKKDFPIFENNKNLIYLDSASTSQKPKQVIKAISNFYEKENANVGRGIYTLAEKASE
ncbi:MAG: aminotransferase class V-fold PLP-dependent enzyme, partial [Candidatus Daviesbacteria bacterium]|nr:aminotransferase class V-fold PLP-dependent enzyme [Candidatus Daviesbacteria bacterium]